MRLVVVSAQPQHSTQLVQRLTFINSDLVFGTHYAYQGNFAGFTIWDVSNPAKPIIASVMECRHVARSDP